VYWLIVPSKRWTPLGQDLEETVEDAVPVFRVDLLGELHRAGHVGEEYGDLLALALDRRA
jgi:hypothetical protein